MIKLKQILTPLINVSFFLALSTAQIFGQLCTKTSNIPANGNLTVNGINVTSSSTGYVSSYGMDYQVCGTTSSLYVNAESLFVGSGASTANSRPWQTTLTFSKPVNNIVILLSATGSIHNEKFEFTSNNGAITITDNGSCFSTISGNTILSGQGASSTGTGGGGIFTLTSPTPFTQLVMKGDGGDSGSLLAICETSIVQSCTGTIDSDGDGIADECDLDDDNDGILDTDEGYCSASTPLLIESKTFSATGSGTAGRPNITFSAPTTGTGKRLMFLKLTIERDHTPTPYGDNWESTLPATNNFANAPVVKFGSINMFPQSYSTSFTTSSGPLHSNATISLTQYVYTLWDSQIAAGPNSFDLSNFQLPKKAGDEWHAEVVVFDQVYNYDHVSTKEENTGVNNLSISGNMLANSQPTGTIEQNNALLVFGATSAQSGMSINSGWNTITSNSVLNTNGTFATDPSTTDSLTENDGISVFTATKTGVTGNQTATFSFNKNRAAAIMYRLIPPPCNLRDTDGDGIPDYLDLDSDADGCPDAKEGAGNFNPTATASGTLSSQTPNINFGTTVDANGIPTTVGASGQAIGNSQNTMVNDCISFVCPPDPYAAQQTWWLPYSNTKVRIDFQSGAAVLNNPAAGFLGQGSFDGFEGNTSVTHPITGELLFVTDGNVVYKGSTGVKATGLAVGGNGSSGEAAAVIPDPNGILGRNFLIIGNSAANTTGSLRMAKYDLQTNTVSGVTTILSGGINEALEVIPHTNGTDYWILVSTSDEKVKTYLYSKTTGFNSTLVSSIDVPNLAGVSATSIATFSFISWDPRTPGKVLISRHNKVGLANFDPSTGILGTWDVKVTVTSGTATENSYTGYSVALSPNGRYIYYNEYVQSNNTGILKYYDMQTGLTTALDVSVFGMNGMKIAPDGKLYKLGYISGVLRLLYLNTDANTPPSSSGSLLAFDTGGRSPSLQLPNNVYWGCITCQSGTAAPALANTNITSNPATVGDLIALLSASNQPAGTIITIHSATPATDANKLANSTAIVAGTTYYASFYDGLAICYSPTTAVTVGSSYCYKPAVQDLGNIYNSKHGITSLGRAGTENENWPMVRQSAWSVLESKTKGLVVNRVRFNASNQPVADDGTTLVITNPVEGMMVYDKTNNCLKMYTSNNGGSTFQWHCMATQACPN